MLQTITNIQEKINLFPITIDIIESYNIFNDTKIIERLIIIEKIYSALP